MAGARLQRTVVNASERVGCATSGGLDRLHVVAAVHRVTAAHRGQRIDFDLELRLYSHAVQMGQL